MPEEISVHPTALPSILKLPEKLQKILGGFKPPTPDNYSSICRKQSLSGVFAIYSQKKSADTYSGNDSAFTKTLSLGNRLRDRQFKV